MKKLPFLALLALVVMIAPAARAQQGLQPFTVVNCCYSCFLVCRPVWMEHQFAEEGNTRQESNEHSNKHNSPSQTPAKRRHHATVRQPFVL